MRAVVLVEADGEEAEVFELLQLSLELVRVGGDREDLVAATRELEDVVRHQLERSGPSPRDDDVRRRRRLDADPGVEPPDVALIAIGSSGSSRFAERGGRPRSATDACRGRGRRRP
jgi:hypothetical protein